jgi:hypothetical protein
MEATGNDADQHAMASKLSYIKQYSNQSGHMEYKCGVWLPLQT